jgi:tetratricopeptide (TPR) repeat protein
MTAAGLMRRAANHAAAGDLRRAESALRSAVRRLRGTRRDRMRARVLSRLGAVLEARGRYAAGATTLRAAIRLAERSGDKSSLEVGRALNDLGVCCKYLAHFAEAGQAYQGALYILERHLGHEHTEVASVYHNLGGLEHAAGNGLRGEPFAREAVRIRTRALGRSHPEVAADITVLAGLLEQQRKYDQAERLYRRAIAVYERAYGPDDPVLFASLNNLAALEQARGRPRRAEVLYRRALAIDAAQVESDHPRTAWCRNNLAALMLKRKRLVEAEALCRQALATFSDQLGWNHPGTGVCLENLAAILRRRRRHRQAAAAEARARCIRNSIDAVNDDGVAATATINPLRAWFRLRIEPSRVHRFGVFAGEMIPEGRRVIEFTGERIGRLEAVRRWNPRRSYMFRVDDYWRLDGAIGGSGAEYINHSCAPNLVVRCIRGRLYYLSRRRIQRNEELTIDYKYDARLPPIPCRCGADSCRGTINQLKN